MSATGPGHDPGPRRMKWRLDARPAIRVAGRFPLADRQFDVVYGPASFAALHQYEYAATMRLGGRTLNLAPGDLTLTPPGVASAYDLPEPGTHLCVHFRAGAGGGRAEAERDTESEANAEPEPDTPVEPAFEPEPDLGVEDRAAPGSQSVSERGSTEGVHCNGASADGREGVGESLTLPTFFHAGPIRDFFSGRLMRIVELWALAEVDPAARAAASCALQELLLSLSMVERERGAAPTGRRSGQLQRSLFRVARRIEARIDRPVAVPELAREVGLSRNYLARQFRRRFGCTIQGYQTRRRIEEARRLLLSTELPVKVVGARVGWPDPQQFNKAFRKAVGRSPTAFRELAIRRTPEAGRRKNF